MKTIKTKAPTFHIEARFMPDTINEENRTVEMVFTTDAPARMLKWNGWDAEEINEVLSMDPAHVRLQRMLSGAPLLNAHQRWDMMSQIGVVEKAWIAGHELRGIVRFSSRADVEPLFRDVKDGITRNGSVGYRVYKYLDITDNPDAKVKTLKAIDWEPVEMSLVPIGADMNAGVRSAQPQLENDCEIETKSISEEENMEQDKVPAQDKNPPTAVDAKAERAAGVKEERDRTKAIHAAVKAAKLGDDVATELIDGGKTADEARSHVLDVLAKKSEDAPIRSANPDVTRDERETVREGVTSALLARALPDSFKVEDKGKHFMRFTLFGLCERLLRMRGQNPDLMAKDEILRKGLMSGSDLPAIFLDAANKAALKSFAEAPQTFAPLVTRVSMSDFKTRHAIKMGDMPGLLEVKEGGEIKAGSFSDEKESYALKSYARKLAITRQMIINDDLSFLGSIPSKWGRKARSLESDLVWAVFTANSATGQTMADGTVMFHADHNGNIVTAGAAPSVTTISVLDAVLGTMTGLDGDKMNLSGKYLIGGPKLKSVIMQIVTQVTPNKKDNVNPYAGVLTPIIEQRLNDVNTGIGWYLAADKADVDMIELATLDGQGPKIEAQEGWDVLGSEMRIVYDVAAHAVEWRGFAHNDGA